MLTARSRSDECLWLFYFSWSVSFSLTGFLEAQSLLSRILSFPWALTRVFWRCCFIWGNCCVCEWGIICKEPDTHNATKGFLMVIWGRMRLSHWLRKGNEREVGNSRAAWSWLTWPKQWPLEFTFGGFEQQPLTNLNIKYVGSHNRIQNKVNIKGIRFPSDRALVMFQSTNEISYLSKYLGPWELWGF